MLVSSALVLMMTATEWRSYYGGLVRRKNVLGTMMPQFIMMGRRSQSSGRLGYSLAFGGSGPFVGDSGSPCWMV